MAKDKKGKEKARGSMPQWRPPAVEDINEGDTLQFYAVDNRFTFRVMSIQHGGEWIVGRPSTDQDEKLGPIAVKRTDCMTLTQAAKVLQFLPSINLDAPAREPLD